MKSIDIKEMFYLKIFLYKKYIYEFSIMLINKSKQPISIINIEIINNGKSYYAKNDKTIITESKKQEIKIMTADFPINLTCLEAQKQIIYFKLDEELENEKFDLIIYTNRGKVIKHVDYTQKQITPEEYINNLF